jgi:ATP-binding cassette subfamily B (MDR/TAP) protein 9
LPETAFFDQTKTGSMTSRLSSDCKTMVDTISLNINIFLRSSVTAIGSIIFMVRISWNLSLLTIIGLPFGFLLGRVYGSLYRYIQKKIQDALAEASASAEEAIGNIRTVRTFANE